MIFQPINDDFLHKHLDEFLALERDFPGGSWAAENFLSPLEGKWQHSLAMMQGNEVIGYIIASEKVISLHIHRFNLKSDVRGKGYGRQMLREFEKRSYEQGHRTITLKVAAQNTPALGFYKQQGFNVQQPMGDNLLLIKMYRQKIIAIHQPNLFPWLGFFSKIKRSDLFVFLDHVEMRPNDAIRPKRVGIINNKELYWLTIPLLKPKGQEFVRICDMQINTSENFKKKHLKTIEQNYKKRPFYDEVLPFVEAFYNSEEVLIAKRNMQFISSVCAKMNLPVPHLISSEYSFEKSSTELLIEISKHFEADIYLAGGGAVNYQEDEKFSEANLTVLYQNFQHPTYPQGNDAAFVPGLSVVDALMNVGFEEVVKLLP